MKQSEIAALFSMIVFYDPKVQFDEGKLFAWTKALRNDMPFEFAREAIAEHYSKSRNGIMPADLNEAWNGEALRNYGRWRKEQFELEMRQAEQQAVPMPEHLYEELVEKLGKRGIKHKVYRVHCPHCKAPPNTECVTPSGNKLTQSYAHPSRFEKAGIINAQVAVPQRSSASDS